MEKRKRQVRVLSMPLPLEAYRKAVRLDEAFTVKDSGPVSKSQFNCIVDELLDILIFETGGSPGFKAPKSQEEKRRLSQNLLTVRPPRENSAIIEGF